jgi:hypothetical protein
MVIINKILWPLIMILLSLLPISTSKHHPMAFKSVNFHEDLPDLRLDGLDTYNDGTIILLFTQKNNKTKYNTTIHLRIIFSNETIYPVEIDCSSHPDFIPKCKKRNDSDACSLSPKALIEGYVLIESVNKSKQKKQMIVSWDKKIDR